MCLFCWVQFHCLAPQVGPAPEDMPLHVYCMRMREHGWNIDRTIRKAQQCGIMLQEQATGACGWLCVLGGGGATCCYTSRGRRCIDLWGGQR
jgi:hypothetical protein